MNPIIDHDMPLIIAVCVVLAEAFQIGSSLLKMSGTLK